MRASLSDLLQGPDGFVTGLQFEPAELQRVKSLVERQWLDRIAKIYPDKVGQFAAVGIQRYHERAHFVEHAEIWPKLSRILPASVASEMRQMSLFKKLEARFGRYVISDEEGVGWEGIFWRLVRPGEPGDVGPLHADDWFVDLAHETQPPGHRLRVWIAIVCQPGRNGLLVIPGSHLQQWRYHATHRHGRIKPQIDEPEDQLDSKLIPTNPGEAIAFSHQLLHGGAVNQGTTTRVSLEFTMCVQA